jgi:unsaturated pyranuronate lyase
VVPTIEWFEGSREALADLFASADDSPAAVGAYRELGRVLVARDGAAVVGHLQLVAGGRADEAQVKSIAVREDRQGAGIGRMLLARAADVCRAEHRSVLLVATAAADTRVLRFYQLLGFRLLRVERDAFTPTAGYPDIDIDGIALRDRVWLSLTLEERTTMAELQKYRWDDMPRETLNPGLKRRLISGDQVMVAHVYLDKGTEVPRHHHHNEQITYILEGALEFHFGAEDEETHTVKAGEAVVIPSNLPHRAVALEDTLDVDVFSPPRQDWLDGTDAYLRST